MMVHWELTNDKTKPSMIKHKAAWQGFGKRAIKKTKRNILGGDGGDDDGPTTTSKHGTEYMSRVRTCAERD